MLKHKHHERYSFIKCLLCAMYCGEYFTWIVCNHHNSSAIGFHYMHFQWKKLRHRDIKWTDNLICEGERPENTLKEGQKVWELIKANIWAMTIPNTLHILIITRITWGSLILTDENTETQRIQSQFDSKSHGPRESLSS